MKTYFKNNVNWTKKSLEGQLAGISLGLCPQDQFCCLPDQRGAGLHMGFKFSYIRLMVRLLRSKFTFKHSINLRS